MCRWTDIRPPWASFAGPSSPPRRGRTGAPAWSTPAADAGVRGGFLQGGLEWAQERPNARLHSPFGEPPRLIRRGGAGASAALAHASRIPAAPPEGYLEGFARLDRDPAEPIAARIDGREPDPASPLVPGIEAGLRGMRFIVAAVESGRRDAAWIAV